MTVAEEENMPKELFKRISRLDFKEFMFGK